MSPPPGASPPRPGRGGPPTSVILNPHAGSALDEAWVREALAFLPGVAVSTTQAPGEASMFAREAVAAGVPLVVVIGGDGTVNEVINGLAGGLRNCELGIIPAGTGNDGARALGIPLDPDDAAVRLKEKASHAVDLIELSHGDSSRLALNSVTGGMGGVVSESMPEAVKERWGPLSYARAAVSVLPHLPVYDCRITSDGGAPMELSAVSVVVANGPFAARGVCVAPGARMDDGLLSVHVILESGVGELASLIPALLRRQVPDQENYSVWEARDVCVEVAGGMTVSVDGEPLDVEQVRYRALPSVLRIRGANPRGD